MQTYTRTRRTCLGRNCYSHRQRRHVRTRTWNRPGIPSALGIRGIPANALHIPETVANTLCTRGISPNALSDAFGSKHTSSQTQTGTDANTHTCALTLKHPTTQTSKQTDTHKTHTGINTTEHTNAKHAYLHTHAQLTRKHTHSNAETRPRSTEPHMNLTRPTLDAHRGGAWPN